MKKIFQLGMLVFVGLMGFFVLQPSIAFGQTFVRDDAGVLSQETIEQIDALNAAQNGGAAAGGDDGTGAFRTGTGEMDTDMAAADVSELNAYVRQHTPFPTPHRPSSLIHTP